MMEITDELILVVLSFACGAASAWMCLSSTGLRKISANFGPKEAGRRRPGQGPERRRNDGHSGGIYHWGIRGEHCGYLHIVLVFRECQMEG